MNEDMPPDLPPSRPAEAEVHARAARSGWLPRLLELGNHNKLIAAATLVTLATGLPYLVTATIGVFSADAEEATLEELLARAVAQVQEQAAVSMARAQDGSAASREAAGSALASLASQARASGATSSERNAVRDALRAFGSGNAAPALARLAEVAVAQEARGDLDAAAQTWCDRGYLQIFTQYAAALDDFERANDLSATGIDASSQRERARLLRYVSRFDESVHALRRAISGARETGDLRMELLASADLAWTQGTSWDGSQDFQREQLDASLRVLEAAGPLMDESPGDLEMIAAFGTAAIHSVGGASGLDFGAIHPTPRSPAVRALLEERLARLGDARSSGVSPQDYAVADCMLRGALAYVRFTLGEKDEAVELAGAALDSAWQVLDDPESHLERLLAIQQGIRAANTVLREAGAHSAWRRGAEARLALIRSMMSREQVANPISISILAYGLVELGAALAADDDRARGIATMREGQEVMGRFETLGYEPAMIALHRTGPLYLSAKLILPLDRELARAWAMEADGMFESHVRGTRYESSVDDPSPELVSLYAELELGPMPHERRRLPR